MCFTYLCTAANSLVGMTTHYGLYDLGSNSGGDEIFRARPDWPRVKPNLLYSGYWF